MRIGIDARVARWHIGCGLGNYTSQIIENLRKIDDKNKYLLFFPKEQQSSCLYRNYMEKEGERKNNFWKLMYDTIWEDEPRVDIFHNTVNGIGIPRTGNYKLVLTMHDLIPYVMPETVDKPHLDYVLSHTPKAIEEADRIITVSHHSKKDIRRYFNVPQEKIKVIYHAADKIYRPIDKNIATDRIEKNYGIKGKFILYLGGFSPRKNIARLIRAFHMIQDEFNDEHKLVILGEPSRTFENLNKLAQKLSMDGKIIFTGFVPTEDLPIFYNACECFVYPSLYEGFGLPPLEAAACGVPVVTSNISSIPEVMGDSCTYINPYDIVNIAQGIYDTVTNLELKNTLREKSLDLCKKYSWEKASAETLDVYKSLL